jgi:hypothetical protein
MVVRSSRPESTSGAEDDSRLPASRRLAADSGIHGRVSFDWGPNVGARVAVAADETRRFIREHIGDAKISAVDPPARRARRIAFCRA